MSPVKAYSAPTDPRRTLHDVPLPNPKLLLPRHNEKELRSFRFFLEKTAPAFAGVFHTDFWLHEVPRACHTDAAIWHAAVSLGAVDESYSVKGGVPPYVTSGIQVQFALQQFGFSIKHLIDPSHRLLETTDKKIALAASILFTCICSIQGLQQQGFVHLRGGLKLLREIEAGSSQSEHVESETKLKHSPLSLTAMHSVLSSFNIQAEALLGGRVDPELLPLDKLDLYDAWRHYHPPESWSKTSAASVQDMVRACQAVESLFNSMVVFLHKPEIFEAAISGDFETVSKQQLPYMRTLQSLTVALEIFEGCPSSSYDESRRKAMTLFRMFYIVCRLLILPKARQPGRLEYFDSQLEQVVDLAEDVLSNDSKAGSVMMSESATISLVPTPKPCTTLLLLIAAVISRSTATRARAIELMKNYPEREGLWDSLMAAELAVNILRAKGLPTTVAEETTTADQNNTNRLGTQYMITVAFDGERRAQVTMKTFDEWMKGEHGRKTSMKW
ncbi:MAG: hypothetical protein M1821_002074 [Bathelium mastoideum]|nr:MAG: hypothetical protein M1821_002074 [Bathelium mastoideum]KAI9692583.1 MAG: hypothetical protein M1822_006814 [Bathelium mastoideum]